MRVEIHLSSGLPRTAIVGLPEFPMSRITINLAPADLPKDRGGRYDLPIALGILGASGQLDSATFKGFEFIGELAQRSELVRTKFLQ